MNALFNELWPYILGWFIGILIAQGIWVLFIFLGDKWRDYQYKKWRKTNPEKRISTQITNGIDLDCEYNK